MRTAGKISRIQHYQREGSGLLIHSGITNKITGNLKGQLTLLPHKHVNSMLHGLVALDKEKKKQQTKKALQKTGQTQSIPG